MIAVFTGNAWVVHTQERIGERILPLENLVKSADLINYPPVDQERGIIAAALESQL